MSSPESINEKPLIEIQSLFRKELEGMAFGKSQSVHGERPDDDGRYSDSRYADKETGERLRQALRHNELLNMDEKTLLLKYASAEDYIRAIGANIQTYSESIFSPVLAFIRMEFGLKIQLRDPKEVSFEKSIFILAQQVNLPLEEIKKRLKYGRMSAMDQLDMEDELREKYPIKR